MTFNRRVFLQNGDTDSFRARIAQTLKILPRVWPVPAPSDLLARLRRPNGGAVSSTLYSKSSLEESARETRLRNAWAGLKTLEIGFTGRSENLDLGLR
jgi:hypothetical protein